jgi:guanylate kinase
MMESYNNMLLENSSHEKDLLTAKNITKNKGVLFIISGPSGVGKGSLRKAVMDIVGGISFSVSCTTRPPREGEIDGIDYRFISLEEFNVKLNESSFLEHALVHDYMYGTLRRDVENVLESGEDILLEIDVQGAFQVKSKMDCVSVFVLPPSIKALEDRLRSRKADSDEIIKLRLKNAEYEISCSGDFDYRIINDSFNQAVLELKSIIVECRNFLRGEI